MGTLRHTAPRPPRADAEQTREALLSSGARLIARHGLGVPVSRIQDEAEQRNKSAVRYHFGSVLELALAVLRRHGRQVDARRAAALTAFHDRYAAPDTPGPQPGLHALVDLLVSPAAEELHTPQGRDYLRLLPQVSHLARIRSGTPATLPALVRTLELLHTRLAQSDTRDIDERLALTVHMHAAVLADRARRIDDHLTEHPDAEPHITPDHAAFVRLVTAMLTNALTAADGGPARSWGE